MWVHFILWKSPKKLKPNSEKLSPPEAQYIKARARPKQNDPDKATESQDTTFQNDKLQYTPLPYPNDDHGYQHD